MQIWWCAYRSITRRRSIDGVGKKLKSKRRRKKEIAKKREGLWSTPALLLSTRKVFRLFHDAAYFRNLSVSYGNYTPSRSREGGSSRNRSLESRETFSTSYNRNANLLSLFKYFFNLKNEEDLGFHSFCREWRKERIFLRSVWLYFLRYLFYTRQRKKEKNCMYYKYRKDHKIYA